MGREDYGHEQDCQGGVEHRGGELLSFVASSSSFRPPAKNKSPTPISRGCHFAVLTTPPSPVALCMFPGPNPSLTICQKALRDVRSRLAGDFDCEPHSIPRDLLVPLHALLQHSLNVIAGLDGASAGEDEYWRKYCDVVQGGYIAGKPMTSSIRRLSHRWMSRDLVGGFIYVFMWSYIGFCW